MTITKTIEIRTGQYQGQFVKRLVGDRCCLGLLRFFGAHPHGRFSELAVIHATDENGSRHATEKALAQLINEGVLKISIENSTCFYLLTGDEPIRQLVLDIAKLDWRQWQMWLEHI